MLDLLLDDRTIRRRLVARRRRIMSRYLDVSDIGAEQWAGLLSDADARCLLAIFEALRRVEGGTYGLCLRCGGVIDTERLSSAPEIAICMVCALFEREPREAAATLPI